MLHRIVKSALSLLIVGLITAATLGAVSIGTWGLTTALNGNHVQGLIALATSMLPGIAAYQLALNRNDLVDA